MLNPTRHSQGFTLLEVLVVIVIIGVMASLATLSVGVVGRDTEVQDQAERLATILAQTQEEAEQQGRQFGLLVERDAYEFLIFDAKLQAWQTMRDDDLLTGQVFPEGLSSKLWLEGRPVVLKSHAERVKDEKKASEVVVEKKNELDREAPAKKSGGLFGDKDKDKDLRPHIFLLSSGELNSFELRIERENSDHAWHILSKPDNTLLAEEISESQ